MYAIIFLRAKKVNYKSEKNTRPLCFSKFVWGMNAMLEL